MLKRIKMKLDKNFFTISYIILYFIRAPDSLQVFSGQARNPWNSIRKNTKICHKFTKSTDEKNKKHLDLESILREYGNRFFPPEICIFIRNLRILGTGGEFPHPFPQS